MKNSFGKWVFQILANLKIKMTRNKNRLFGCHFKTVQHFEIFREHLNVSSKHKCHVLLQTVGSPRRGSPFIQQRWHQICGPTIV